VRWEGNEVRHRSWARCKRLTAILLTFGLVFLALAASAQAVPGNDDFLNAKPLAGPPLSVEFDDNEGASAQAGEPNHAGNAGGHSVWYSWTPSIGAHVVVSTCTLGPGIDTLLAVYTGSAVNSLIPVASNDERGEDRCNSTDSELAFDAGAGITYRIAVDGKGSSEGEFELVLRGTPPNDEFDNAETIEPGVFLSGDTRFAGKQSGEPNHAGDTGGHSVWYSWTPANSGPVHVSICSNLLDGSLNSLLAVYTGSTVGGLTAVASNDDAGGCWSADSALEFTANAGTTYRIAVDGKGDSAGNFSLVFQAPPGDGGGVGGGGSSLIPPPAAAPAASADEPKQLRCKRGFRKKMLRGKVRCVKKKKGKRRR
jgi:hypothetical protein